MPTMALQIGREDLTWSCMPEHLTHDGDNPIEGRSARWPLGVPGYHGDLPDRIMAYALVLESM